jgi:hypothetical protein
MTKAIPAAVMPPFKPQGCPPCETDAGGELSSSPPVRVTD